MLKVLRNLYFPFSILITSIIMLPICLIRFRDHKNTELFLRLYAKITIPVMGFKVKIENKELLDQIKPSVLVGNHQHNLDIMMASQVFRKNVVSLGKKEIIYLPLFGQIFWLAGNILINRGSKEKAMKTMANVEEYVKRNKLGIVIFPEGHRNQESKLLDFKKGAFYTAINCQIPIVPFVVSQYAKHMDLNKWHAGNIYIKVLPPIPTEGLTNKDIPELMIKTRKVLEDGIIEVNKEADY